MSWEDRDYNQSGGTPGGMGRTMRSGSVVLWLIGINAGMFLLTGTIVKNGYSPILDLGNFNIQQGIYGVQIWRWLTYQYLHAGLGHVFFNMLGLFFFGPLIEQVLGRRRFFVFYTVCGLAGPLLLYIFHITGILSIEPRAALIGASGCEFGVIVAAAVLYPHQRVMLILFPVPLSLRSIALVFLGLSALSVLIGADNAGGDAAHLAGAAAGFLLIKRVSWLDFGVSRKLRRSEGNWKRRQQQQQHDEKTLDRILQKVHDHGIGSLNWWEKRQLRRATQRQHQNR